MDCVQLGTVVLARVQLGSSEKLGPREYFGGVLTLLGIVLVTQPSAIFGGTKTQNDDDLEGNEIGYSSVRCNPMPCLFPFKL